MVTCTITPCRAAVRLNSGVSPQKKWFSAKSFFFAKAKELLCPTLARAPAYLGPNTPPPGGTSLGFKPKPIIQAFGGNSRLQWANNSFKPTPLRGVVVTSSHPSVPASATLPQRRGLIQALAPFIAHRRVNCCCKLLRIRGVIADEYLHPSTAVAAAILDKPRVPLRILA